LEENIPSKLEKIPVYFLINREFGREWFRRIPHTTKESHQVFSAAREPQKVLGCGRIRGFLVGKKLSPENPSALKSAPKRPILCRQKQGLVSNDLGWKFGGKPQQFSLRHPAKRQDQL
jgi:hypothetical protein